MTDTSKVSELVARLREAYIGGPGLAAADCIDKLEAQLVHITAIELDTAKRLWKAEDERDALRAEVEAPRKDAERYRWIRARRNAWPDLDIWEDVSAHGPGEDRLDRAIDAAATARNQE